MNRKIEEINNEFTYNMYYFTERVRGYFLDQLCVDISPIDSSSASLVHGLERGMWL